MSELNQPLLRSLPATSQQHNERIMAHVDALPELAAMIDRAASPAFAERFRGECDFISHQLIPHIAAVEETIYSRLDQLMERRHSMLPMREEHARLHRLFDSLCAYRATIDAGTFDRSDAVGLRRVLYRLYSLLKVHMAEEEMYLAVLERDLSDEEKDLLARGIDHAAAAPV
jgi:hypothetical protein